MARKGSQGVNFDLLGPRHFRVAKDGDDEGENGEDAFHNYYSKHFWDMSSTHYPGTRYSVSHTAQGSFE